MHRCLRTNPELQQYALRQAGAICIFTDYESGSKTQRPQLAERLSYLRGNGGVVLVV
ncbi:recombinase family protein [Streptomyces huasconensis]|uniref:recombinase family protein n=1 Tax=Streptomyces huasconensis TaxID=1854574 RepID=UPI0036F58006